MCSKTIEDGLACEVLPTGASIEANAATAPGSLPPPTIEGRELAEGCRKAFNGLAASAFFLAGLAAVAGGVLLLADPPRAVSHETARGVGMVALVAALVWFAVGFGSLSKHRWAVYLAIVFAGLNLVGGVISLGEGLNFSIVAGLLVNFGVLTQAEKALKLAKRSRWNLVERPDFQCLVAKCDVDALLHVLHHGGLVDQRLALQALGSLGKVAAVPKLVEVVLQRVPPRPDETDCCRVCRRKLRAWNRDMGKQLCGKCARQLRLLQQNPENVPPSPSQLAAEALGRIGPAAHSATPVLQRARQSADPRLRQAARWALNRIQRDDGGDWKP